MNAERKKSILRNVFLQTWLPAIFWLVSVFTACGLAADGEDVERTDAELMTPRVERCVERAIRWLASQQHEDGGFGSGVYRGDAGVSALVGMAMLADGSTPGRGAHGRELARCVDYLLAHTQASGFITGGDASHGPMYGHGFATMFLAECCGMAPQPELREKLSRAVRVIVDSQNKDGGWRYQPVRADADVSVTACQVMALRAARNAGLYVPNETIERATAYIKKCQNADGGFAYMMQGGDSAFPRSAAAVAALYSAGVYRGPEIAKGLEYVVGFQPSDGVVQRDGYYFYGHYYAVQAMWQAGGPRWRRWYAAVCDDLLARQRDDGSWQDSISAECATAMACVALALPNNYLPIFQR